MGIWTPNTPGSLSDILTGDDAQDEAMRSFEHGSTEPATKVPGLLWSCTNSSVLTGLGLSTHALLRWNGSAWQKFLPGFGGVLPFVAGGFMDLGGAVPSNLGAPSSANHAARNGDVLKKDGSVALTVTLSFTPRVGIFTVVLLNSGNTRVVAPLLMLTPNVEYVITPVGGQPGIKITPCDGSAASPLNFTGFRVVPNTGGNFGSSGSSLTYMFFK